uniref:Uncharacterized protein n=1 Tax=Arundo donax TaxID=35708 RepID=A0A0A9GHK5_ARUDO
MWVPRYTRGRRHGSGVDHVYVGPRGVGPVLTQIMSGAHKALCQPPTTRGRERPKKGCRREQSVAVG